MPEQQRAAGAAGAASLMAMFEPPQPAGGSKESENKAASTIKPQPGPSSLQGLFQPPPPKQQQPSPDKQQPATPSPQKASATSLASLFDPPPAKNATQTFATEATPLIKNQKNQTKASASSLQNSTSSLKSLFDAPTKEGGLNNWFGREETKQNGSQAPVKDSPTKASIREVPISLGDSYNGRPAAKIDKKRSARFSFAQMKDTLSKALRTSVAESLKSSTWIGAFMFLLNHVVFCLTMGSSLTRQHGTSNIIGLVAKMAAGGVIFGAPIYWMTLGDDIPALYPTIDLFPAPFLASMATTVDEALFNDPTVTPEENDQAFLTTFCFLLFVAMVISSALLMLASVLKLANLAAFLPSAVLGGFFAAIGVLTWTLAFKIDSNGFTVGDVLFSGDLNLVAHSLLHHAPTVVIGLIMRYLGPKNPFYVAGMVFATIVLFHVWMFVFGLSLDDMVEHGWFWNRTDLSHHEEAQVQHGLAGWAPPTPMGWMNSVAQGRVHWGAVQSGMSMTLALGFLFMIRVSLHGAALKKNVSNMQREVQAAPPHPTSNGSASTDVGNGGGGEQPSRRHRRFFSEAVDIENLDFLSLRGPVGGTGCGKIVEAPKPTKHTQNEMLRQYSISIFITGLVGSFPILPSVALSVTMYTLHAENIAPQFWSVALILVFYYTDFELVGYIPKPAFSSLLFLGFLDLIVTWLIKSYHTTKSKTEWLVVPLIVILAYVVGLLGAVFLGIAISTFFFVGSFYQSGVVKFVANGITIQSTVERRPDLSKWLDQNGDLVQVLVLQNFLFFGNATSVLNYVTSMFEDPDENVDQSVLPPLPKVVVLDFSLVSGMDGSAVDVMAGINAVCKDYACKVFFSGLSPTLRHTLLLGGVVPDRARDRSQRQLRYFPDLDTAIGKAEDMLLSQESPDDEVRVLEVGFRKCLAEIDKQHGASYLKSELVELGNHTRVINLQPSEILYEHQFLDRGLFFVEEGIMKIERSANYTNTRTEIGGGSGTMNRFDAYRYGNSLNQLKARSGTIGRQVAQLKSGKSGSGMEQKFRVARIGPGWVLGALEALSGMTNPGCTIAVSKCRLHYISYATLEKMERENPLLTLKLYKLLSFLMAKRQEKTIGHLATLHSIMGAPAHKGPLSRGAPLSIA